MDPSSNKCAVIGNPIAHSLSPVIHQHFASQFDMSLEYERIEATEENFNDIVTNFFANGGHGMNVTSPFKEMAFQLADERSEMSEKAISCNTLYMVDGKLTGTTTDGDGWLADIRRLEIPVAGKRLLFLGAGGATRILIHQLLALPEEEAPAAIIIANRTVEKLEPLKISPLISTTGLNDIPAGGFDLIVNGLSVGLKSSFPDLPIEIPEGCHVYDLNYGKGARPFLDWAEQVKKVPSNLCHDGWGMLVNQAAYSFSIWWQNKPSVTRLIEAGPQV